MESPVSVLDVAPSHSRAAAVALPSDVASCITPSELCARARLLSPNACTAAGQTGGSGAVLARVLPMLLLSLGLAALALAADATGKRPIGLLVHLLC